MASERKTTGKKTSTRRPPATTPLAREQQLVSAAVDLAEKQLQEGTASAQVLTHYLKLGSSREHLEQERLRQEVHLLEAKREAMAAAGRIEELYGEAIKAMRRYNGEATQEQLEEADVEND
jgi:hypothetical protein